jgi:hypothetical protein
MDRALPAAMKNLLRRLGLSFATLCLAACSGKWQGPTEPPDCAAIFGGPLYVSAGSLSSATSTESLQLVTGQSRNVFLVGGFPSECASLVRSLTWSVADPTIVSLAPHSADNQDRWATGVAPGTTTIVASLALTDGRSQQATRTTVVSPPSPAGVVVLEGTVELEGYTSSAQNVDWSHFIPFTLPQDATQVDATVDWSSLAQQGNIVLFSGACAGDARSACPVPGSTLVASPRVANVKPLPFSATNVPAGAYTLRVDLLGSGRDTVRYEVRMTPR